MHTKYIYSFVKYIFLLLVAITVLVPLIYVLITSFTPLDEIGKRVFIPDHFSLRNYRVVLFDTPFVRYIGNTLFVGIVATAGNLLTSSLAAFGFARVRFPGRNLIFMVFVATMIIPGEVLIVPMYMLMGKLGWVDSYNALIIPALASAFNIFFLRQFFLGLPQELEDAAYIDGCGRFRAFWNIMLPLIKAPLMTLGLLTFFATWDSFLWPLTVINSVQKQMIQVAISLLNTETFTDVGAQFSNVVLSSLPIIIFFLLFQKYYLAGITAGSVKG